MRNPTKTYTYPHPRGGGYGIGTHVNSKTKTVTLSHGMLTVAGIVTREPLEVGIVFPNISTARRAIEAWTNALDRHEQEDSGVNR